MQGNTNCEDEIELIDLLRIVWRRKNLIIFGTIIIGMMGTGLAFFLPKVFEVVAVIEPGKQFTYDENGQIIKEQSLLDPSVIREVILSGAYDEIIRVKLNIPETNFPKIKVSILKDTSLLKIFIESKDPQKGVSVLEKLIHLVGESIQDKVIVQKQLLQNEITVTTIERHGVTEQGELLQQQVLETQKTIQILEDEKRNAIGHRDDEAMAVLLYSNEIQNKQEYLNRLQEKIKSLEPMALIKEAKLEKLRQLITDMKALEVLKKPSIPNKAISPKKGLIVVLSFMLGIMGSTMLAFLFEYIKAKSSSVKSVVSGS